MVAAYFPLSQLNSVLIDIYHRSGSVLLAESVPTGDERRIAQKCSRFFEEHR
jgi:hypothetical protein